MATSIERVRQYCLSLPYTTEKVQWEDNLVFKVGGKMYAVVALEPGERWLSFKSTPDEFAELLERPGIVPAPYLARAHWVCLESERALPDSEIKRLLGRAHQLTFARLPRKTQAALNEGRGPRRRRKRTSTTRPPR